MIPILNRLSCFHYLIPQVFLWSYLSPESTAWEYNAIGACPCQPSSWPHIYPVVLASDLMCVCPLSRFHPCFSLYLCPYLCLFLCLSLFHSLFVLGNPSSFSIDLCSPEPLPCVIQSFTFLFCTLLSSGPTYAHLSSSSWKLTISL